MIDYLLTYLWTGMECYAAVLLFDGFSERRVKPREHWLLFACFVILDATVLNLLAPGMGSWVKLLFAIAMFSLQHFLFYHGNGIFCLYIAAIFYGIINCVDNLCFSFSFFLWGPHQAASLGWQVTLSFFVHLASIAICYFQKRMRKTSNVSSTHWKWYTVPVLLSLSCVLLIFFLGNCFLHDQIAPLPLLVCGGFITVIQVAALFLVSWMEQNSHFREETISLQTRERAQQENIEALKSAYAQQRKLTHDFQAHLDVLSAMLEEHSRDTAPIQEYVRSLQAAQPTRLFLVNTRHASLDALLNQKAFIAKKRKIDIQFMVNDLSPVVIDMADLTTLIGNTLDNAIEASEKLQTTERQILVQLLLEDDELFFSVRNRSLPVAFIPGQLPPSTKEDPSFHGFGLENVRTILRKYKSVYALNYEDGWFNFATDLPNTLLS